MVSEEGQMVSHFFRDFEEFLFTALYVATLALHIHKLLLTGTNDRYLPFVPRA